MIYLLNAIVLTTGGSSTVHIYTQAIHRPTQFNDKNNPVNNLIEKSVSRAGIRLTCSVSVVLHFFKIHKYDHLKF